MNRRQYLSLVGAGLGAGTAGCTSDGTGRDGSGDGGSATDSPASTVTSVPLARLGSPATICEEELKETDILAITTPEFGRDWSGVDPPERYGGLSDDEVVVGLTGDGEARAYPLSVLWYHEVVNDVFPAAEGGAADRPVMVTFCPICNSGMVAERVVDGSATTFAVTGLLWRAPGEYTRAAEEGNKVWAAETKNASLERVRNRGNLVMFDAKTGSYWSQILARAICGPKRGESLSIVPSTVTPWGEWRDEHPDTEVLLPPPASGVIDT